MIWYSPDPVIKPDLARLKNNLQLCKNQYGQKTRFWTNQKHLTQNLPDDLNELPLNFAQLPPLNDNASWVICSHPDSKEEIKSSG